MGMTADQRKAYASRAGTTAYYIKTHLVSVPPRKVPREGLMRGLAQASNGDLSMGDVLAHFYGHSDEAA